MQQGRAVIVVIILVALAIIASLLLTPKTESHFVAIGTGSPTGVYYQVGNALVKVLGETSDAHSIDLSVQTTDGSVYNINALISGDIQFGVAQSDRQYQAYNGLAEWEKNGPQTRLRAICSFHPEMVTLVAADESGIKTLADVKGKTVNIGNAGSGQRGNAMDIFRTAKIDPEADFKAESLKAGESAGMLHDGRIDAFFYTVGHPNGAIQEATSGRRKVRFIPITGMEKLLAEAPYYAVAQIPADLYSNAANTEKRVPTVGVMTTLLTSSDVPESVVKALTRAIFTKLATIQAHHPAFKELTPQDMLTRGLSAPFHRGALAYYKEAGLAKHLPGKSGE